jgi:hypothetical protein
MWQVAFHRPLAAAVAALYAFGVGLAVTAAVASVAHQSPGDLATFSAVAVVLALGAPLVWRRVRWVVALSLIVLGGQVAAMIGSAWELATGISSFKASQLTALGFDPTWAVTINLIYSSVAFGLFCWFALRWLKLRRTSKSLSSSSMGA